MKRKHIRPRPPEQRPDFTPPYTRTSSLRPRPFPTRAAVKPYVEAKMSLPVTRKKRGDPP